MIMRFRDNIALSIIADLIALAVVLAGTAISMIVLLGYCESATKEYYGIQLLAFVCTGLCGTFGSLLGLDLGRWRESRIKSRKSGK